MKCAVIYGSKSAQHHHFIESGKEYFDTVLGVPLEGVRTVYGEDGTKLMYKSTDLTEFDCVFIRFLGNDLLYGEHIPEILQENGVYTQLDVDSLAIASNKFYTVKVLAEGGMPVPTSTYTLSTEETERAAGRLGYPVVIKIISGYGGKGVMKADSESDLSPIIDTLTLFEQDICLQEFVENPGEDIRVVVVGDEVYSYKRVSEEEGEWRSNVGVGGNMVEHEIDEEKEEAALKAARLCGFDYCGLDIIEGEEGFYFGEINASPGHKGEEEMFGFDPYGNVMEYLKQKTVELQSERGL